MSYTESWSQQWMMHEWVRDFCHAHGATINAKKTKYIISNWRGENDPRWLSSVDGLEQIVPLPSSHQFRYLGLWLSMDLCWNIQRQQINNQIMNWRWKANIAKANPAQLKSSILEWLFPRLEIGLIHANVTKKMCEAWMSTIVETLSRLGGMSTLRTINREAFCVLSGIPDLWTHINTIRATELLVNLNTTFCLSGRSTLARFCSFMGKGVNDAVEAIQEFDTKGAFYCRAGNRITSTLQFLKNNGFSIVNRGLTSDLPGKFTKNIRTVLSNAQAKSVIVYTDGSTKPYGKYANSGCGVVITDPNHKLLFEGGMTLRSDGNNFMAELAAASCVIKALPPTVSATLRIDSKATIGALSKGAVSERRRIRAAGRPWLNFCRTDYISKRNNIKLEHVSSHKGNSTPEQIGNAKADQIANHFRLIGEKENSYDYFTQSEEPFILKFKQNLIQGDPRIFLKKFGKDLLIETWKKTAPKQAVLIRKHLTQVLRQSQRVWKWAIDADDGKAWVYFIFAVCQWLPTNRRVFYQDKSPFERERCQLCLSGSIENIHHLWKCPALEADRVSFRNLVTEKLIELKLPYAQTHIPDPQENLFSSVVRETLQKLKDTKISENRLRRLARDCWNRIKKTKFEVEFFSKISKLFSTCQCPNGSEHLCGRRNLLSIPEILIELLSQSFTLNTEANTSSLGRSIHLQEFCSTNENDLPFGSLGSFESAKLTGKNCLLVCTRNESKNLDTFSKKIRLLIDSKLPTRILLVLPTQLLQKMNLPPRKILNLAYISKHFLLTHPEELENWEVKAEEPYSMALAINQESMLIDPIQWEAFKKQLLAWAGVNCPNLIVPELTDNLFNERTPLSHAPRAKNVWTSCSSSGAYKFFDPMVQPSCDINNLISNGIPIEYAKVINRMNFHNRDLSMLGILPNQIRWLFKQVNQDDGAFEELSKELFWNGYKIWKTRKRLMSKFWREIAPIEWKIHNGKKDNKKSNKGKKQNKKDNHRIEKKANKKKKNKPEKNAYECANPFHFLKRHCDLSNKLPTPCQCSKIVKRKTEDKFLDMQSFLINQDASNISSQYNTDLYTVREDLVRGAHDRGKRKRKYTHAALQ